MPIKLLHRLQPHCAFCGKKQKDVNRLIRAEWSGAHICDDCIDLCHTIVTVKPEDSPEARLQTTAELLADLEIAESMHRLHLRGMVGKLRERDVSWVEIGGALKMSAEHAESIFQ